MDNKTLRYIAYDSFMAEAEKIYLKWALRQCCQKIRKTARFTYKAP